MAITHNGKAFASSFSRFFFCSCYFSYLLPTRTFYSTISLICYFFKMMFRMLKVSVFILGPCSYSSASKAFLFSLYNAQGYNPVKLTQYQNQGHAMYGCSTWGPFFGGHDIRIYDNALNNQGSQTYCGFTYSVPSGYSSGWCRFLTPTDKFTPTDIEVFYEISQ